MQCVTDIFWRCRLPPVALLWLAVFIESLLSCHIQFHYQYVHVHCCSLTVMILVAGLHVIGTQ